MSVKALRDRIEKGGKVRSGEFVGKGLVHLIPKKVNALIWRAKLGRIPTRMALNDNGIDLDSVLCPRCGHESKDVNHALVT